MFFALSKILLFFTYPLIWILFCLIIFALRRKKKDKKIWLISGLVIFIFFSNPYIFLLSLKCWEGNNSEYIHSKNANQPYDAIVVLGGYSSWNTQHQSVSFNQSSDRILESIKLYHSGKGKKIVLTGGSGLLLKPEEKESIWMKDYLIKMNVSPEDIITENNSRNTHENAVETAKVLREKYGEKGKYLLVTSASHMNRSKGCFETTGLNFDYYRVDFLVDSDDFTVQTYILPSAMVLEYWQFLIKEWLGYFVYWTRGYL